MGTQHGLASACASWFISTGLYINAQTTSPRFQTCYNFFICPLHPKSLYKMQIWSCYSLALKILKIPIALRIKKKKSVFRHKVKHALYYLVPSSLASLMSLHAPLHILQSSQSLFVKKSLFCPLEHANWPSIFLAIFAISCTLFSQLILTQFLDFSLGIPRGSLPY